MPASSSAAWLAAAGAALAASTALALGVWEVLVVRRRDARLAGRRPAFLLGSLTLWRDLLNANRVILADFVAQPGKPLVQQWTFWRKAYAVVRHDHVDAVFKASTSREMRPRVLNSVGLFHIKHFMGPTSVGVAEGQLWRDLRKTLAHSLRPLYIKSLLPAMERLVSQVQSLMLRDNKAVDVSPLLHALTLDVVCSTVFKQPLGALEALHEHRPDPLVDAFSFAAHEMARRTSSFDPLDWLYGLPLTRANRELMRANATIEKSVNRIIAECKDKQEETLVSHLIEFSESDQTSVVRDNVVTLTWAGHDTTAAALSFTLRLLADNPAVQDTLRRHVCGKTAEEMAFDAAELDAVCWESLRLHPPALWTNRGLTEPVSLDCGKAGTVVMQVGEQVVVPIWAIHRCPANWDDPDSFRPFERFMGATNVARNKGRLIPFGSGNRICPGNALAVVEFKLALGLLISRLRFEPVPGVTPTITAVGMFQAIHNNVLRVLEVE